RKSPLLPSAAVVSRPMAQIADYVKFGNRRLGERYARKRIPMSTLYEAYFDGDLDFETDLGDFIRDRDLFVRYSLTRRHLSWAVTHFLPEVAIHSKRQDRTIVREHSA